MKKCICCDYSNYFMDLGHILLFHFTLGLFMGLINFPSELDNYFDYQIDLNKIPSNGLKE